jgi:hypothetical protein
MPVIAAIKRTLRGQMIPVITNLNDGRPNRLPTRSLNSAERSELRELLMRIGVSHLK